jgi:hypothetical protein
MKWGRCIYDEKPSILFRYEMPVFPRMVDRPISLGHALGVGGHIGLFSSLFSIHSDATTLFDTLKRKKNV